MNHPFLMDYITYKNGDLGDGFIIVLTTFAANPVK